MRKELALITIAIILLLIFVGCQPQGDPLVSPSQLQIVPTVASTLASPSQSASSEQSSQTSPETPEPTALPAMPTATTTPKPEPLTISSRSPLPSLLLDEVMKLPSDQFQLIEAAEDANLIISLDDGSPIAIWIYAPVERFATFKENLTVDQLNQISFLAAPETAAILESRLPSLEQVEADTLSEQLWQQPGQVGIVPFDQLTPDLKPLDVMGISVLERELDIENYPLAFTLNISGDPDQVKTFLEAWGVVRTNRDENKMTTVAMTGVTALVRATAAQMESQGVLFPGEVVAPILQAADIAHISNEVPFAENCPYPDAFSQSLVFCSRDTYFELLTHLEADVIEVTGNHSNDWGRESMVRSLDFYEEAGMQYYGGGRDLEDGLSAAIFEDHGNKIAFIGCNPVGPAFAWATATAAGATPCGDYTQIEAQITALAQQGYLVIATMQYQEIYAYQPTANQVRDYSRLAAAGAAAVSGSQSHHPQGFAFQNGSFIHYGLGNLFFDQMNQLGTRQMFIDTYIVYDNQIISVELWTGLIEFYARPREMTQSEREALLRSVFTASGW